MPFVTLLAAMIAAATPMTDRDMAAPGPQGPLKGLDRAGGREGSDGADDPRVGTDRP